MAELHLNRSETHESRNCACAANYGNGHDAEPVEIPQEIVRSMNGQVHES
jgi:hypothetical protein